MRIQARDLGSGIFAHRGRRGVHRDLGFIGLVGPHIARIFVGSNSKYLIPASAAFGAAFLLFADTIAKVTGVNGLPVGVICLMIGGPLFVFILVKQRKSAWA